MNQPHMLGRKDEHALVERYKSGDNDALHALTLRHQPLVHSMAERYRRAHTHLAEDLTQQAFLGLLEAADRFDPTNGARFNTYARWWIRHYLQSFIERSRVARLTTREHRRIRNNLSRVRRRLEQRLGRDASNQELSDALRTDTTKMLEVLTMIGVPPEPITTIGIDSDASATEIADVELPVDEAVDEARRLHRAKAAVSTLLSGLNERERQIVECRILSTVQEPLRTTGSRLGISGERIRQIQVIALQKMRAVARSHGISAESVLP